jgi:rhodanese-related sulfurtransferase
MFFNNVNVGYKSIGPEELSGKMRSSEDFLLLDVRTPQEHAAQAIEGARLIPLQELSFRVDELPKDKEIVVYCRVGSRSAHACSYLSNMGFNVKNLEGGITVWNTSGNVTMTKGS